ncbi:MAG: hypothetical protein V1754_13795 [Pseudomonadota bacterium]
MKQKTFVFGAILFVLAGCAKSGDDEVILPAHCNPISSDRCLLPWPSSFYLREDSTTKTGFRVNYPSEAMPKNNEGKSVDMTRYNLLDGFSPASQMLVYFESGISKEGLPAQDNLAKSITDESLIWVLEYETGDRFPLFAEIDANAKTPDVPALIIRTQARLKYNSRYVVVLRSGLKDRNGNLLQPPDPFRRLRDGLETRNETLLKEKSRMDEVFSFLDEQNIPRSDVVLAWDFHTASEGAIVDNLVAMVDEGVAKLPATGPKFSSIETIDYDVSDEPHLLRSIEGKMSVPSYLASDENDAWLNLDANGKPVYRADQKFFFRIHIPRCAETATGPLPVLILGHGMFSSPRGELLSPYQKELHDRLCMVEATAYWHGLSESDLVSVVQTVILDFSELPRITDQLAQSHVNWQALTKLMKGPFLADPSMQVGGQPVSDGKEVYYLGVSNGGIQGVAFSAFSKDIDRFIFHVMGGWWSMMMQRSSNFVMLAVMLERTYGDVLDRLMLISLSQQLWDPVDPINYANYVRTSPLPGRTPKKFIIQEARDDITVPNIATRAVVRALGIEALSPVVEHVYGIPEKDGPLDAAYAQWDINSPIKPSGENVPTPNPSNVEERAHDSIRTLDSCIKQMGSFFKPDGQVVHYCDGPCDPE